MQEQTKALGVVAQIQSLQDTSQCHGRLAFLNPTLEKASLAEPTTQSPDPAPKLDPLYILLRKTLVSLAGINEYKT